ncbi:MAG: hypothetical protein JNM22_21715 [Saprospiraceae bacterium]|nr:hypothetical protein [Saprospiraceae bacterium]
MLKVLLFISLFQFSGLQIQPGDADQQQFDPCPAITELEKTGETSNSYAMAWDYSGDPILYKVWYVRQSDNYFSGYFYTTNTNYNFTGLSSGGHTFYCTVICRGGESGYIGIEDLIGA